MRRALRLAELGHGRTSPNPMVGAVLVKENIVVGEGYHPCEGESHAEALAIRQAGEKARGATMCVTLEPCCHFGRTPPGRKPCPSDNIRPATAAAGTL